MGQVVRGVQSAGAVSGGHSGGGVSAHPGISHRRRALRVLYDGRVDMRVRRKSTLKPSAAASAGDDWEFFVIQVIDPYLEERSEVAMAAGKRGIEFADLIERIVHSAIKRTLAATTN